METNYLTESSTENWTVMKILSEDDPVLYTLQ